MKEKCDIRISEFRNGEYCPLQGCSVHGHTNLHKLGKRIRLKKEFKVSLQESEYSFSSKSSDVEEESQDELPKIPHILCTEALDK